MSEGIKPELAVIYYDETDPQRKGWAYNVRTADGDMSGALQSVRRDAGLQTLHRQLRAEFAAGRVEIPAADTFRLLASGDWEARRSGMRK